MAIPAQLNLLIERFRDNLPDYKSGKYNETQVRREFIDPLFKLLGWDIDNDKGYAEAYKEVVHEDALKVGQATKAPDYGFRVGGQRKFFLEAKKPSVNIKEDTHPAYQLRRYAWSAKLPLSILTDFEEFAVYDCRVQPDKGDKAAAARIMYLQYEQYPAHWDELVATFSPEAIQKGAFDRYVESTKAKKGTTEVDSVFLQEIERWRDSLARNLARRNSLSQRQLNFAVQRIIDRVIFLRIAEDRGLEPYGQLRDLAKAAEIYPRLIEVFRRADDRYNSGLFHFQPEKGRDEAPDRLTPGLAVDDKIFKDIFRHIYYPDSPYEFSVLSADILGQVYEQFLGKVIRLTPGGHRAEVEDKPEVKKAGGVYYTPTYIVEYIVRQTVGKLVEGKQPQEAERLKIADPACGSGSFLLGAYQFLLEWYRDRYIEDGPTKWAKGRQPRLYQTETGGWKLSMAERKRILLAHIYGVDIDPQAVEVTKLSLLLRVLEDEKALSPQLELIQARVLPDLGNNIKCGNSLIGPDFYSGGQQLALFDEEELHRVNAFDWQKEFPQIMRDGGFDAVIGNPPYIRIQALKEWAPLEVELYKKQYKTASKGNYDIYVVFVEKGLSILNEQGRLGLILPSKFLSTDYGILLRSLLAEAKVVDQVVDFGHSQVFQNATTYTCLLFLNRIQTKQVQYLRIAPEDLSYSSVQPNFIPIESLGSASWLFANDKTLTLLEKINSVSVPLLELPADMSRGTSTGDDDVFCLVESEGKLTTRSGQLVEIEDDILRRPLYATDFTRFHFRPRNKERIIFPYTVSAQGYDLIEESVLRTRWPKAYEYLKANRKKLDTRKQVRVWYGYSAPRNLHIHDQADFLVPLLADRGLSAPMPKGNEKFCVMASAGFSVSLLNPENQIAPAYVLGLVNSKLLFWNLRLISNKFRGGWITCTKQYFGTLPIRTIDFTNPTDKARHDQMVGLVEQMLSLHQRLAGENVPQSRTVLQRQIEATDRQIDRLVYELYGLSEEEIEIVEG